MEGEVSDQTRESDADRQWRESSMWQKALEGYERVPDADRMADPRYTVVEKWTYKMLAIGNCPGSIPVAEAIVADLDALDSPSEQPAPPTEREEREETLLGLLQEHIDLARGKADASDGLEERAYHEGRANGYGEAASLVRTHSPEEPVDVVAAVRRDDDGMVWLCKRNSDGAHTGLAGMWEYPGGKVEDGEQLREALVREILEEFPGCTVDVGRVLDSITSVYEGTAYRVTFFEVAMSQVSAHPTHDKVGWFTPDEACALDHLPSGTVFNARHLASPEEPVGEEEVVALAKSYGYVVIHRSAWEFMRDDPHPERRNWNSPIGFPLATQADAGTEGT